MTPPRIGYLGVGWIGRSRMAAMIGTGRIEATAICDPSPDMLAEAQKLAPGAVVVDDLAAMLALDLDGVVIGSPSALHAAQSIAALEAGIAVFCQKPLGRSADEARSVVDAARHADKLLGVDFSYRFTDAMRGLVGPIRNGSLGQLFAADLVFHNAYGPDKPWFYDVAQSGGGCVMDLGVHLVDLALWTLGWPEVEHVTSQLFAEGAPLAMPADRVEDYAVATITLAGGAVVRLACSWRLHAGRDAVIEASFYGTQGGAALRNVAGSFYDFTSEIFRGTAAEMVATPPDDWGVRAAADWAVRLADGARFDPESTRLVTVSKVMDAIYGR
jgi:predicted dehydrogenase